MLGYKKGQTKELCGSMPLHYPADRVYLHGDTNEDAESAIDGKVSKSGDTMTGDLTIDSGTSQVSLLKVGGSQSFGGILLCAGSTNYKGNVYTSELTGDRSYELPNKSGTLALTSDIPVYIPISGDSKSQTITFSGKTYRRRVSAFLVVAGQAGVGNLIPIMFTGSAGYGTIIGVRVASNSDGVTASGSSITIPRVYSDWGYHTIIKIYNDEITYTVSES